MDLTTLARLQNYLAGLNTAVNLGSDAQAFYAQAISRASDQCMQWTGRNFQRIDVTGARFNGSGTERMRLPNDPIIAVTAVSVDEYAYTLSPDSLTSGFQYDTRFIYLMNGAYFRKGMRNVKVSYSGGYTTTQTANVPSVSAYTITPTIGSGVDPTGMPANTSGPALVDRGVTYASTGVALVAVASAPAAGQYSFSGGVYTFNAADAGKSVIMSYDYVPGAVEQGVIELIGHWFSRRMNLGVGSISIDRQTVSYIDKDLPDTIKGYWQPYRYVIAP